MDIAKSSWVARAETAIRALRDIESVSVQADGDNIREIHVLTRSTRVPKQIVRDVQTVLLTRLNRSIDFRVVSVAYLAAETGAGSRASNGMPATNSAAAQEHESEPQREPEARRETEARREIEARREPEGRREPPSKPATGELAETTEPADAPGAVRERIRFGGVNLFVSGPRTQAQVELRWRGLPRLGSASGWSTRAGANELIAKAALNAVQEFLVDELAISLQELDILKLGRRRAVVVSLSMLVGRQEKTLIGSCVVEQDVQQAVVCATLGALNRVVAALRPKEPTEYVLRPTSEQ